MTKELLMGNAAVAIAALNAGVNVISGYPGTPSSEVLETIAAHVKAWHGAGLITTKNAPHVEWSINEKAALEVGAGAAMSGARALVTMKQVGLNVASDAMMSLAYLGTKAGLVLFVADDPGPISSQTEQDTRQFAQFAKIPVYDATTPEELYSMIPLAFELSEQFATPVIVRATTRICHGSAAIELPQNYLSPAAARLLNAEADKTVAAPYTAYTVSGFERSSHWVSLPGMANQGHREIMERLPVISNLFCNYDANQIVRFSNEQKTGIAASGVSWAYLLDSLAALPKTLTAGLRLLKVASPFPFIDELAVEFLAGLEKVLVFEELEAVVERELLRVAGANQIQVQINGKLTGQTTVAGENSVALIAEQLNGFLNQTSALATGAAAATSTAATTVAASTADSGSATGSAAAAASESATAAAAASAAAGSAAAAGSVSASVAPASELLAPPDSPARPPVLCAGCPHRASFSAVKKALRGKKATFSGDIGCYTLGNALPLEMVDSCVCMGAGFTVPQGMQWAEPDVVHLGFLGDSTFFASGMTGVANAVYNRAPVTLIVLDNSITAMTGSQPHPGTGLRMSYDAVNDDIANAISILTVLKALGVKHVVEQNPLDFEKAVDVVREAVEFDGVSAIVFKSPCINVSKPQPQPSVDTNKCTACRVCINTLGCPALTMGGNVGLHAEKSEQYIEIVDSLCYGCDLCVQVCPFNALISNHKGGNHAAI